MYYRGKGGIRSYKIKYIYKYCRHYLKHVLWAHNINALKIYILVDFQSLGENTLY